MQQIDVFKIQERKRKKGVRTERKKERKRKSPRRSNRARNEEKNSRLTFIHS